MKKQKFHYFKTSLQIFDLTLPYS